MFDNGKTQSCDDGKVNIKNQRFDTQLNIAPKRAGEQNKTIFHLILNLPT
jgi:hypothetical protein